MSDEPLIRALEKGGDALMRIGDSEAAKTLYAEALRHMPHVEFRCNVDESAGMAEIHELSYYSRKVICE